MKRKRSYRVFSRLVLLVVLCFLAFWFIFWITDIIVVSRSEVCALYGDTLINGPQNSVVPQYLSLESAKSDLRVLVAILKEVHPLFQTAEKRKVLAERAIDVEERLNDYAIRTSSEFIPRLWLYWEYCRLTASLHDAHTFLRYLPQRFGDVEIDRLPISFEWLKDGLVIGQVDEGSEFETLHPRDRVVRVNGYTPEQILDQMKDYLSTENEEWLKCRISDLLPYAYTLGLFETHAHNEMMKESKGATLSITDPFGVVKDEIIPMQPAYTVNIEKEPRAWFGWSLISAEGYGGRTSAFGYFWLDQCTVTAEYEKSVADFFEAVAREKAQTVVIDLRKNMGGDSSVVDAFLEHLPKSEIIDYTAHIRASGPLRKVRGLTSLSLFFRWIRMGFTGGKLRVSGAVDPDRVFRGNVLILTSNRTFSSANYFAVLLKDNGLAQTIGEPTGNAPTCYGDILEFSLPESCFEVTVSTKEFVRPDVSKNDARSLEPDIPVARTVMEYQMGIDPAVEWIRKNLP